MLRTLSRVVLETRLALMNASMTYSKMGAVFRKTLERLGPPLYDMQEAA